MRTIKAMILVSAILLPSGAFATTSAAEDCIIDPDLMNKDTWAEPIFSVPATANSRAPASDEATEVVPTKIEKNSDQYLEVQKTIPHSEPSLSQAWVEWTVNNEN